MSSERTAELMLFDVRSALALCPSRSFLLSPSVSLQIPPAISVAGGSRPPIFRPLDETAPSRLRRDYPLDLSRNSTLKMYAFYRETADILDRGRRDYRAVVCI